MKQYRIFPLLLGALQFCCAAAFAAPDSMGSVPSVAALRAGIFLPTQFAGGLMLDGYYTSNDGGGGPIFPTGSTSCTDDGAIFFKDLLGNCLKRAVLDGRVSLRQGGAKVDGTTADQVRINATIAAALASSDFKGVYFNPGSAHITDSIVPACGLAFVGEGPGISKITFDDTAATGAGISYSGSPCVYMKWSGIGISGVWATHQDESGQRNVYLQGITNLDVSDFECSYSRQMCFSAYGSANVTVNNLLVDYSARDAFNCENCQNVQISNYRCIHGWDDCVAWSSDQSAGNPVRAGLTLTNLLMQDILGIKTLGAKVPVMSNVVGRLMKGYCFDVTYAGSFNEGSTAALAQVLSGITCTDAMNTNLFAGAGSVGFYGKIGSFSQAGSGTLPWRSNGATIVTPWAYDYNNRGLSSSVTVSPGHGLVLTGLSLTRTIPSGGTYSSLGFNPIGGTCGSQAFTSTGCVNPVITEAGLTVSGLVIGSNGLSHAIIQDSFIMPGGSCITADQTLSGADFSIDDVTIQNMKLKNCLGGGIAIGWAAVTKANLGIFNNDIDGDPFVVSAGRNGGVPGGWQNVATTSCIDIPEVAGVVEGGNSFHNCSLGIHITADTVLTQTGPDTYYGFFAAPAYDPGNLGIGSPIGGQRYVWQISDPTNVNFGQILPSWPLANSSAPAGGYHFLGQEQLNTAPACAGTLNRAWIALTTSGNNVPGTDSSQELVACP